MSGLIKTNANNFVPVTRTPWAGSAIGTIKHKYLGPSFAQMRCGESWEVSTCDPFQSMVSDHTHLSSKLTDINIGMVPKLFKADSYCPLLLKWIHSSDVLSVQLHPNHDNALLEPGECGKPEAWYIFDAEPGSFVYLGFVDGMSKEKCLEYLANGQADLCLHKYFPEPGDFISVPPGCVHAVGPGILLAEPQQVVPNRVAKTWRLSDWNRRYDTNGQLNPTGALRELHLEQALLAIDWNLPRGAELDNHLVLRRACHLRNTSKGPFFFESVCSVGKSKMQTLSPGMFSVATVRSGKVTIQSSEGEKITLVGGESIFISATIGDIDVDCSAYLGDNPWIVRFALEG